MAKHQEKPSTEEIIAVYEAIEESEPNISDASLFARVCDHFNGAIDNGDIADALAEDMRAER